MNENPPTHHDTTASSPGDTQQPRATNVDPTLFTMTVAEALQEFLSQGCSTTERTIQRYCHSAKLDALRVNPDSREQTDKEPYMFLINPTSVAKRISVAKEQQEFSRPTVVTTSHDSSRRDATLSDNGAAKSDDVGQENAAQSDDEIERLKRKVQTLEIDKAVRDKMVEQLQDDRKILLGQIEGYVTTITTQSRELGSLETRLEIAAPKPPTLDDKEKEEVPKVNRWTGDDAEFRV